ncbi:hypothetical protein Ate01nite_48440 [Actinoplanes teichomyceticus]|nr:hypothetical protein Ate01nite_48440 [Actinoplanes teichomyceticus]
MAERLPVCDGCGHYAAAHADSGCADQLEMAHSSRPCPCRRAAGADPCATCGQPDCPGDCARCCGERFCIGVCGGRGVKPVRTIGGVL